MKSKIALVTGAGRGIGKAIALALAKEGMDVAVNARHLPEIEVTAAEIETLGQRSMAVQCDVSDYEAVKNMVQRIINEWGGIDILVNNAGVAMSKMWEDMEKEEWEKVIDINLGSVLNCSKAVIETMKQRGGGNIVNISSMAAKSISDTSSPDYTASKAGVIAFTRQLAYELGPHNIRVNVVCPATVMTTITEITPEAEKKLIGVTPLRRLSAPEDIANVVTFLVSDKARMITGATIDIDGGQRLGFLDWETYVNIRKGLL
ncbi:MAG: SDR family NAD(P)-dependent oxidoreductase [Dehalococcoidales bacterium]